MRLVAPLAWGWRWWAAMALLIGAAALLLATRPAPVPAFADVRGRAVGEARLLDRHGRVLGVHRADPRERRLGWAPLAAVSPALTAAALRAEDRRFAAHAGVDWRGLAGAARDRLRGAPPRGASTVTMQVAGLLGLDRHGGGRRGPLAKLRQMRAALALERRWSKAEILEAWLNLAPFRGELVGVGAAARLMAGKAPGGLDRAESLALAALLPAPSASPAAVGARACRLGGLPPDGAACIRQRAATRLLLTPGRFAAPDAGLAPQLAARLLAGGAGDVRTTLDAGVQRMARDALARRLADLRDRNVRDGAALVVDNATGDILAYVASAGAASTAAAVDGARAPRQAGSTLKPFLYALAIDRRLLTAASILDDAPVSLESAAGLYVPQNYDRTFRGPVSARTALAASLNVPAVRALLVAGIEPFRDLLLDAGYAGLTEEADHYGYSLALGSAEVTLLEQAAAYRALARGGVAGPLRLLAGAPAPAGRRVIGAPAAAIVADMLADRAARAETFGLDSALALPFWAAVKTGTSKVMRDNWCVGFSRRYTVAVWVGNFEGDAMAGVSGTSGAAPAWREIMLRLHDGRAPPAPPRPAGLIVAPVRFAPAIEPPRQELFVAGTQQPVMAAAAALPRRPRITAPADGALLAIDPDIPPARQRLLIRAEAAAGLRVSVGGRDLGPAAGPRLWPPVPGTHVIALTDPAGGRVDAVRITVR